MSIPCPHDSATYVEPVGARCDDCDESLPTEFVKCEGMSISGIGHIPCVNGQSVYRKGLGRGTTLYVDDCQWCHGTGKVEMIVY